MKTSSSVVSAELTQGAPARGDPLDCLDPIHTRVTTRDGVQLAVRDYGPRSAGHAVVFLHGFCLTHASWARHIQYLVRRYGDNIRVIAYDHRGHGDSAGAPMHTYRIDQLATDLADVLHALNVTGPVTLVGHSMGGMTALAYLGQPPPTDLSNPTAWSWSPPPPGNSRNAAWGDSWPPPTPQPPYTGSSTTPPTRHSPRSPGRYSRR